MSDLKQVFENSFSVPEICGFSTPITFEATEIGVSLRRDFGDESASLMKVSILHQSENNLEPIYISITHGKKDRGDIVIRDTVKLTDPIDLFSLKKTSASFFSARSLYLKDCYFYDKTRNIFLKNNKETTANNLVQEVFEQHIKTTKLIQGLFVRMQLWFWGMVLPILFYTLFYNFFRYILYFISGDQYTYNIFKGVGELDEKKSKLDDSNNKRLEPKKEESEKMDVFGYKLSQHAAVMYSFISLGLYFYFHIHNVQLPKILEVASENMLVVLFYVIVTLHFFDKWLPLILKSCIDGAVRVAYYFVTKPIGV